MSIPGQRLAGFAEVWQKSGAEPALLSLIRDGHKIVFQDVPPPCTIPSPDFETKLPDVKMNVIRAEIFTPIGKGAIQQVLKEEATTNFCHYSKIFALPETGWK